MESLTATLDSELELTDEEEPMPEVEPDSLYEVVNGRIVEKPEMGAFQVRVASILFRILGQFAWANKLGNVDSEMLFLLDPDSGLKRRPDLAFVSYERWPKKRPIPRTAAWNVVPDLAIEVISPTNLAEEVIVKINEYFRVGAPRVWVIYPIVEQVYVYESSTSVRILTRADRLEDESILAGFSMPLAELFGSGDEAAE
jgi:Uma2 family endonuclease